MIIITFINSLVLLYVITGFSCIDEGRPEITKYLTELAVRKPKKEKYVSPNCFFEHKISKMLTKRRIAKERFDFIRNDGKDQKGFENSTASNTNSETLLQDTSNEIDTKIEISNGITFEEKRREDAYKKTTPEDNPYSVLLMMSNGIETMGICTGSLLTDQWILTAGHCLYMSDTNIDKIVVYAGGTSKREHDKELWANASQVRTSTFFKPHPEYHPGSFDYDVGVVKVESKFMLSKTVNTVKLAVTPWSYISYRDCSVTGFGVVLRGSGSHPDDTTRKTHHLKVKQPCLCAFRLKSFYGKKSTRKYICSKPLQDYGVCSGDSGSGLICDGELRGVTSMGLSLASTKTCDTKSMGTLECGQKDTLSIFEDVCFFVRWINDYVKLYEEKNISNKCVDIGSFSVIEMGSVLMVFGPLLLRFIL